MHPDFQIESVGDPGHAALCLQGEIDMATAPQLAAALRRLAKVTKSVVLDFSNVAFMDSSGLNVLVAARNDAERPMDVRIRNASPDIVRTIRISGLVEFLLEGQCAPDARIQSAVDGLKEVGARTIKRPGSGWRSTDSFT